MFCSNAVAFVLDTDSLMDEWVRVGEFGWVGLSG